LKVFGRKRARLNRGSNQDLPGGTKEIQEENGVKVAGFSARYSKKTPSEYKFRELLLHQRMQNFLWI
jgi:hypothetical protein